MKLKQILDLVRQNGEVMVKMSDGSTFELHIHNVKYDEELNAIVVDGATEIYWLFEGQISYAWIHKKAKE